MPVAGMVLRCMSIVRRVVGMLGITDRVDNILKPAGVSRLMCGFAGMAAVVRSMVALCIRPRMIVGVMVIFRTQRRGDESERGERN